MSGIIEIGVALIGGWLGKRLGKSQRVGGRRPMHKVTAPTSAVVAAATLTAITGEAETGRALVEAAVEAGGAAVAVHSVAKNVWQLIRN